MVRKGFGALFRMKWEDWLLRFLGEDCKLGVSSFVGH